MVDRSTFLSWNYRQPANQCVLAAYAAALWPQTGNPALSYFDAYCRHFGLSTVRSENAYESDFHNRAAATPGGGFGVVNGLHAVSAEAPFAQARKAVQLNFLPDGAAAWAVIEDALRTCHNATAQIFINDNPGSPFVRMHSVALAIDKDGLYAYDSNGGRTVDLPGGKSQLGLIGHSFLFVP